MTSFCISVHQWHAWRSSHGRIFFLLCFRGFIANLTVEVLKSDNMSNGKSLRSMYKRIKWANYTVAKWSLLFISALTLQERRKANITAIFSKLQRELRIQVCTSSNIAYIFPRLFVGTKVQNRIGGHVDEYKMLNKKRRFYLRKFCIKKLPSPGHQKAYRDRKSALNYWFSNKSSPSHKHWKELSRHRGMSLTRKLKKYVEERKERSVNFLTRGRSPVNQKSLHTPTNCAVHSKRLPPGQFPSSRNLMFNGQCMDVCTRGSAAHERKHF